MQPNAWKALKGIFTGDEVSAKESIDPIAAQLSPEHLFRTSFNLMDDNQLEDIINRDSTNTNSFSSTVNPITIMMKGGMVVTSPFESARNSRISFPLDSESARNSKMSTKDDLEKDEDQ